MKSFEFNYLVTSKKHQGVIYNEGIAVLVALAKKHGVGVNLNVTDLADFDNGMAVNSKADYHAIGFSSTQFRLAKRVIKHIHANKNDGKIIVGGIHATLARETLVEMDEIDVVVSGEGEPFMEWLYTNPDARLDDCDIPNVCVKGRSVEPLFKTKYVDVNALPFPDRSLFNRDMIRKFPEFILSRGCPNSCKYCANEFLNSNFGVAMRKKTPDYAVAEIKDVISTLNVPSDTTLTFHDDVFIAQRKWLGEFGEKYLKECGNPFRCNTTAAMLNDEKAKMLKDMNCEEIWIGVEVGNEKFRREVLDKKVSNEQIINAFEVAKKHGLNSVAFILMGVSGEKRSHVFDTMKLCRKIQPTHLTISIFVPLPGTSLYDMELKNGNVRELDEKFGDLGVVRSGLKRKAVSDIEYSLYTQLLQYYTEGKTLGFILLQIYKLPIFTWIRPLLRAISSPFRSRLLLHEKKTEKGRNE